MLRLGHPPALWRLFTVDFTLRTFYQMGKTPLLPVFAAGLGAGEAMIGLVIAASTCTGIVAKPVFGFLSDCWGRRRWLFVAAGVFVCVPFLYPLVGSPEQLFVVRQVHGLATAILGPVTLAYVIAMASERSAERVAIFGMARGASYVVAPILSGGLVVVVGVSGMYPVLGLLSCIAIILLAGLPSQPAAVMPGRTQPQALNAIWRRAGAAFRVTVATPALWVAGGLEMMVYVATYATKAFLPLHVLNQPDGSLALAGIFFTVQELVHLAFRPVGGRMADRLGFGVAVCVGTSVAGLGLVSMGRLDGSELLMVAVAVGAGQGLAFPAAVALLGRNVQADKIGTGMGLYGALRNVGKVTGPIIAGVLLERYGFVSVFQVLGVLLMASGWLIALLVRRGNWQQLVEPVQCSVETSR